MNYLLRARLIMILLNIFSLKSVLKILKKMFDKF